MHSASFVKVFDVLDSGFKDWTFVAFGLGFVAIGLVVFFGPRLIKATGIPFMDFNSRRTRFFRYAFPGFAIFWTIVTFSSMYPRYLRHHKLASENTCNSVEGPVQNFVPMPYSGHSMESFSVGGTYFQYSDYMVTDGFNNTEAHGGPIHKDSYVRICYDPSDRQILRLEIRDYKGPIKDYSKTDSPFPSREEDEKHGIKLPVVNIPWYYNAFIFLYILDYLGIWLLFVPYLNIFFTLRSNRTPWAISATVPRDKKTKLQNLLLLWDSRTQAIWLRPRGFNFLQVPLVVAKLVTNEHGTAVLDRQIRFSSGFPCVMVIFLVTAYKFFSLVMPPNQNGPSPGQFVGIATVFFSVMFGIQARRLVRAMERLTDDALVELGQSQGHHE